MNDKIFELEQELVTLQDSLKDTILSEPDLEKQVDIIANFSKEEENLSEKIEKEIEEEVKRIEQEAEKELEEEEEKYNYGALEKYRGLTAKQIAKKYKQKDLIDDLISYGIDVSTKEKKIVSATKIFNTLN